MLNAMLPVRSLLVAIFILMTGSGFLATLISLRLAAAGVTPVLIGLVATCYFVGLTIGSLRAPTLIAKVGHIRAFAAFVSIFSASTLAYAIYQGATVWAVLRFIDGVCMAGVFVCLESWLNERAEPATRGSVLAFYMIALYSGQAAGQFLLNLSQTMPSLPFMAASILLSLAIMPVVLTRMQSPVLTDRSRLTIQRLYEVSPLGIAGAAITGVMLGAFYALGAIHVRRIGMDLSSTAIFMSVVIFGGVVLQWQIGRLSDLFDRRRIITVAFGATALVCLCIAIFGAPGHWLLVLGGLFGGLTFALYPLCVAHTNDRLESEDRVAASGALVLVYSAGAAIGPLAGAAAMTVIGPAGLYVFLAICASGAFAYALRRQGVGVQVPNDLQQPYQILPRTTPMSAELDPYGAEELH